jgi:DNA ligase-1
MSKIYEIIESIAAIGSTKAKQAIMEANKDNAVLKNCFLYAENPRINFFIKIKKEDFDELPAGSGGIWLGTFEQLNTLVCREITGNDARRFVYDILKTLTLQDQEILARIINRDLRCNAGTSLSNKVWQGLIPETPYMRCNNKFKDTQSFDDGAYSQLKADGSFANVDHIPGGIVSIYSRSGSVYPQGALGTLLEQQVLERFKEDTQSHGELVVIESGKLLTREKGNGILNSLLKGGKLEANQFVAFDVWDQIPLIEAVPKGRYKVGYKDRYNALVEQLKPFENLSTPHAIRLIETRIVYSMDEAIAHYREKRAEGLEGTVVKFPDGEWKDTTSNDQVKMKDAVDIELEVTGFTEGSGKRIFTFGAMCCKSSDGLLLVNISGFSDKLLEEINADREGWIGGIVTVRANAITEPSKSNKDYSLFLPRFIERRLDKTVADSLARIKEQFEASMKGK